MTWDTRAVSPAPADQGRAALDRESHDQRVWSAWQTEMQRTIEVLVDDRCPVEIRRTYTDTAQIHKSNGTWVVNVGQDLIDQVMVTGPKAYPLIKGVLYHELAHAIWSPLAHVVNSELAVIPEEQEKLWAWVLNALEDQRIEINAVARWRPMKKFFMHTAAAFLLAPYVFGEPAHPNDLLLLSHRFGVPTAVRDDAAAEWDHSHRDSLSSVGLIALVDEYVNPATSQGRRFAIVRIITEAIYDPSKPPPLASETRPGAGQDTPEGAAAAAEAAGEPQDGPPDDEGTDTPQDGQDAAEAASAAVQQAEQSLAQESKVMHDSIKSLVAKSYDASAGQVSAARRVPVTPAMQSARSRLKQFLRHLKRELDDEWVDDATGKLNARSWLTREHRPSKIEHFRAFEQGGEKEGSVHAFLLIDTSSSMDGTKMTEANQAAWVLGRALADIDAKLEVITFSQNHDYGTNVFEDNRYSSYTAHGGTNPATALNEAAKALMSSRANNRLCIILTDGEWGNVHNCEATIEVMNRAGITTVCAGLGTDAHHKAIVERRIQSANELIPLVRSFVADATAKARRRR